MHLNKKFISLAIIIIGIIGAIIVGTSSPKEESGLKIISSEKGTDPNLAFKISRKISQPFPSSPTASQESLTDLIAKTYLGEIFRNNPAGAQKSGDQTQIAVPADASFEEILQNYLQTGLVWTRFEIGDIKTTPDNSSASKISYLEALREILDDRKKTIDAEFAALAKFLENQNSNEFSKYVEGVQEKLSGLLALVAPAEVRIFHLQVVNAWQHQLAVYKAILAIKEDPARALLGINELTNMANELSNINLAVEKEYASLKS